MFGAIGVAVGTLVGSVFSIAAHVFYSIPRTQQTIRLSRSTYVFYGVGVPLAVTAPLIALAGASVWGVRLGALIVTAVFTLTLAMSAALLGRVALVRLGRMPSVNAGVRLSVIAASLRRVRYGKLFGSL
jgi:hypothetical protein